MEPKWVAAIICFLILLITGSVLFGVSFGVVQTTEYGIVYDHNWQTIASGYKESGRYLVGLGRSFVIYPRTNNLVQFLNNDTSAEVDWLDVWSNDGVTIFIEVSFYYYLIPDMLVDLYFEFGDNWYAVVVRHAQAAIRNTATTFTTTDYLQERTTISQAFSDALTTMFNEKFLGGAVVYDFELRQITFDDTFDTALTNKIAQLQEKNTTEIQRNSTLIDAGTNKINVTAYNQIDLINAQASAEGQVNVSVAQANFFNQTITQYAVSYAALFKALSITDQTDMLHIIYATELSQISAAKTVVGAQNVLINV